MGICHKAEPPGTSRAPQYFQQAGSALVALAAQGVQGRASGPHYQCDSSVRINLPSSAGIPCRQADTPQLAIPAPFPHGCTPYGGASLPTLPPSSAPHSGAERPPLALGSLPASPGTWLIYAVSVFHFLCELLVLWLRLVSMLGGGQGVAGGRAGAGGSPFRSCNQCRKVLPIALRLSVCLSVCRRALSEPCCSPLPPTASSSGGLCLSPLAVPPPALPRGSRCSLSPLPLPSLCRQRLRGQQRRGRLQPLLLQQPVQVQQRALHPRALDVRRGQRLWGLQ